MKETIVTYNVNGMGDYSKRREVFYYLHKMEYNVIFMQENFNNKNVLSRLRYS